MCVLALLMWLLLVDELTVVGVKEPLTHGLDMDDSPYSRILLPI